jgi:hypothetical protein
MQAVPRKELESKKQQPKQGGKYSQITLIENRQPEPPHQILPHQQTVMLTREEEAEQRKEITKTLKSAQRD